MLACWFCGRQVSIFARTARLWCQHNRWIIAHLEFYLLGPFQLPKRAYLVENIIEQFLLRMADPLTLPFGKRKMFLKRNKKRNEPPHELHHMSLVGAIFKNFGWEFISLRGLPSWREVIFLETAFVQGCYILWVGYPNIHVVQLTGWFVYFFYFCSKKLSLTKWQG